MASATRVKIRRLNCRVTVKTGGRRRVLMHKDMKPPKPALAYSQPPIEPRAQGPMESSQSTTEERGQAAGGRTDTDIRRADPNAVADRVYELMTRELLLAKQRGEGRLRG